VAPESQTDTFVALRCNIDNWRWAGVPFFLRTGKKLAEGARIVSIAFKEPPKSMFPPGSGVGTLGPDHLTFDLADSSRLSLSFYGKRPGPGFVLDKLSMQFSAHDTDRAGCALGAVGPYTPVTKLDHYINGTSQPAIPTYFFRTTFTLDTGVADQLEAAVGNIVYDDAVRIYVNGEKVANFRDGRVDDTLESNLQYAGENGGNPVESSFTVPADLLHDGVAAVDRLHQILGPRGVLDVDLGVADALVVEHHLQPLAVAAPLRGEHRDRSGLGYVVVAHLVS